MYDTVDRPLLTSVWSLIGCYFVTVQWRRSLHLVVLQCIMRDSPWCSAPFMQSTIYSSPVELSLRNSLMKFAASKYFYGNFSYIYFTESC